MNDISSEHRWQESKQRREAEEANLSRREREREREKERENDIGLAGELIHNLSLWLLHGGCERMWRLKKRNEKEENWVRVA